MSLFIRINARPQAIQLPTLPECCLSDTEAVAFLPNHKGNDLTPFSVRPHFQSFPCFQISMFPNFHVSMFPRFHLSSLSPQLDLPSLPRARSVLRCRQHRDQPAVSITAQLSGFQCFRFSMFQKTSPKGHVF